MKRTTALAALLAFLGPAVHAAPPLTQPPLLPDSLETYRAARQHGGPGKDGIPSIDEPRFWSAQEAERFLDDGDRVIGYYHNGVARAYPRRILVWHEIVNDTVGGKPVSITYCPLTGTALGFERGDTTFGVSGKLVNSNLVMYDRATGSEYSQILATGIAGPNAGAGLQQTRVIWTTWGNWKSRYPKTQVLSTDTGYIRSYRRDPYGRYNPRRGYYAIESSPVFPVLHESNRFPPKRMILGFRDAEVAVAILPAVLAERGVIHYRAAGSDYVVIHDPVLETGWVFRGNGAAKVEADEIRFGPGGPRFPQRSELEPVNAFEAMWFAWAAFYPDTVVIDGGAGT